MNADQRRALNKRNYRIVTVARCFKACFLGPDARTPTYEGLRVLRALKKFSKLDKGYFARTLNGAIDPLALARIEGRREVVLEIMRWLKVDPSGIGHIAEVDDA